MDFIKTSFNSDFVLGAGSVVVLFVLKKLYDAYQYPSEASTEKIANLPIPKRGDDTKITVWGFAPTGGYHGSNGLLFDYSPYVDRVEAYLHLKKVDYVKAVSQGLAENPRKKVPFVNISGTMMDDSSRILHALHDTLKDTVESTLSDKQRAEGTLIRALLFGRLYYVMNHAHFGMEKGRAEFRESLVRDGLPGPLVPVILAMVVRGQNANLCGVAFAQLPTNEIWEIGRQGLRALAVLLTGRTYILDTKEATVYDTDVYAFLGHFFYEPLMSHMAWVQEIRRERPVLDQYMDRMRDLLFPDSKKAK